MGGGERSILCIIPRNASIFKDLTEQYEVNYNK